MLPLLLTLSVPMVLSCPTITPPRRRPLNGDRTVSSTAPVSVGTIKACPRTGPATRLVSATIAAVTFQNSAGQHPSRARPAPGRITQPAGVRSAHHNATFAREAPTTTGPFAYLTFIGVGVASVARILEQRCDSREQIKSCTDAVANGNIADVVGDKGFLSQRP